MPIYVYQCESCGGEFEVLRAISAAPLERCSECGGKLERIFSSPSLNLGHFTSRSAERHAKLTVEQQARKEGERLTEHAKRTSIPLDQLFEDHDHH
jgi:putative FmdB family regulatory protein